MNKDRYIAPTEYEIVGGFERKGGQVKPNANSLRIAELRCNLLQEIAASAEHYSVLYRDPNDGRYWELVSQNPEGHGGGTKSLVFISDNEAKVKYQLEEI